MGSPAAGRRCLIPHRCVFWRRRRQGILHKLLRRDRDGGKCDGERCTGQCVSGRSDAFGRSTGYGRILSSAALSRLHRRPLPTRVCGKGERERRPGVVDISWGKRKRCRHGDRGRPRRERLPGGDDWINRFPGHAGCGAGERDGRAGFSGEVRCGGGQAAVWQLPGGHGQRGSVGRERGPGGDGHHR